MDVDQLVLPRIYPGAPDGDAQVPVGDVGVKIRSVPRVQHADLNRVDRARHGRPPHIQGQHLHSEVSHAQRQGPD